NMVVAITGYSDANGYDATRTASGLAISKAALVPISPPNQGGNVFGLHPNLSPEVANAAQVPGLLGPWSQGKLAILCNYGSLLRPTTKAQYQSNVNGAFRPYQLFSHSDQVNQQMSSIVKTTGQTGWGGRIADNTGALNGATVLPMSMSVAGTDLFETCLSSRALAIGRGSLSSSFTGKSRGPWSSDR